MDGRTARGSDLVHEPDPGHVEELFDGYWRTVVLRETLFLNVLPPLRCRVDDLHLRILILVDCRGAWSSRLRRWRHSRRTAGIYLLFASLLLPLRLLLFGNKVKPCRIIVVTNAHSPSLLWRLLLANTICHRNRCQTLPLRKIPRWSPHRPKRLLRIRRSTLCQERRF